MSPPLPLPIRVLVKGSSTVSWISWMSGPRSDFAFPRVIEARLLERGLPAEVRNTALLGTPTKDFFRTWEEDVLQWSPDVVVIIPGHYEAIHLFLPHWFERHANAPNRRRTGFSEFYFRGAVRFVWKMLATLQSKIDGPWGARVLRRRLTRVGNDLENYVKLVRQVGSPLVYILELLPPSGNKSGWFPGMTERIAFINDRFREVVARLDHPEVRLLEVAPIAARVAGDDLTAAVPDGFHYTPELHSAVGTEIARGVAEWAALQRHLEPT